MFASGADALGSTVAKGQQIRLFLGAYTAVAWPYDPGLVSGDTGTLRAYRMAGARVCIRKT